MPIVSQVDRKVAEALRRAGLSGVDATLVVGVSGGADSSALLYSLNHLRHAHGLNLRVAHLNHDFRGEEADEDARFVEALAVELGLPFSVEKRDPIAYQREHRISSFEQGAREMRYEFMANVAHRVNAPAVAVGHTSDDLAETVLLHILRGTGLYGLRGMTETAPWPWPTGLDSPVIFRPLLSISKEETVQYCQELGREYRQDSGNLLFRFTRNRVRRQLMPLLAEEYNPRVQDALVRLASTASLDLDYMESELQRVWPDLLAADQATAGAAAESPSITLLRQTFNSLHPAMKRMALRRAYVAVNGDPRRLRENHLRAMTDFVSPDRTAGVLNIPGGLTLHLSAAGISLSSATADPDCPYPELPAAHLIAPININTSNAIHFIGEWQVVLDTLKSAEIPDLRPPDAFTAYFDPAALGSPLSVRKRLAGDRFQPLGMPSMKTLQNFFVDAKVPRQWRDRVPLLVGAGGIAWVVGYRIAEWAKVPPARSPDTNILRVRFTQIEE